MKEVKLEILIVVFVLFISILIRVFIDMKETKEPKIRLSEDDLLVLTERAFLEGYKAALLKQDEDSVWVNLSNEYSSFFKQPIKR